VCFLALSRADATHGGKDGAYVIREAQVAGLLRAARRGSRGEIPAVVPKDWTAESCPRPHCPAVMR